MNILFFTHYAKAYGANLSLLNLIEGLKSYSIKSFVALPEEGDFVDYLKKNDIPFFIYNFQPWMQYRWKSENLFKGKYRDVEHLISGIKRGLGNLAEAKKIAGDIRELNINCIYTNSSITPIGMLVARNLKLPHVWHLRENAMSHYNLYPDLGLPVTNKIISKSNKVIVISKSVAEEFFKNNLPNSLHIIHDGIFWKKEIKDWSLSAKGPSDRLILSIVGILHKNKGQDQAIRALALLRYKYDNIKLIIAGGGNDTYLKKLASDLNVEKHVEFAGYVKNPVEVYQKSDIVLMCSNSEGLGRVTIEAMAAKRPIIGKASGGTKEIIRHEFNGLLYNSTDEELADSIIRLHEDEKLVDKLVENAYTFVRQNFTIESYSREIYAHLNEVCSN